MLGWYWVVGVGPMVEGRYQYSIITDSEGAQLTIMARDPLIFEEEYEKEVVEELERLGFGSGDGANPLIKPF